MLLLINKFLNKFQYNSKKHKGVSLTLFFIKWIFLGSIVGIATGTTCTIFLKSLEIATYERTKYPWLLFLLPLGGVFISFLYIRFGKNSSKGNNLIIDCVHSGEDSIPLRMAPLVSFCTFITHLLGGSAGREGVGVQIGGSLSEWIGKLFKVDETDRKLLLLCGISSGFGSIFGTPLTGTIFGLEVIAIGGMKYDALIPCFTASFVGSLITSMLGIHHSHQIIHNVPQLSFLVVLKVIIASILFGLTSVLFAELTHKLKKVFSKYMKNPMVKSFVGGIVIISLVYIVNSRDYLGLSLPLITNSFEKAASPFVFLLKTIFTSLTLSLGFQGGEVTPLFVIGSTLGSALSPFLNLPVAFLAAMGYIAVFCGATNTPIACFILSIELFGSEAAPYMLMACIVSYLFSGHSTIYTSQRVAVRKYKLAKAKK